MEKLQVRAIADPSHLIDWMEARGHRNLVLSVADIRKMEIDWQLIVIETAGLVLGRGESAQIGLHLARALGDGDMLDRVRSAAWLLLSAAVDGYIVLPVGKLRGLDMADLQRLQDMTNEYRDRRRMEWKPIRVDRCDCGRCHICDNGGEVEVLVEMSDEEIALAEGK